MARYIIKNRISDAAQLKNFDVAGTTLRRKVDIIRICFQT